MYSFVDTTESPITNWKGPEAFTINGVYLEDVVPGYHTLSVSGREMVDAEITTRDITGKDGVEYINKRYAPRVITIEYQLMAETSDSFRGAFNLLNKYINDEEMVLIFDDEDDKYFKATRTTSDEVPPGRNNVLSTIEFYCSDPFKYALELKEATASQETDEEGNTIYEMDLVNDGSVECPIDYEITMNSENGYIGIVSEDGAMEFGDISEVDSETVIASTTWCNYKNGSAFSGMTTGASTVLHESSYVKNGTWKTQTINSKVYAVANGVSSSSTTWHGAARTKTIEASRFFKARANVIFEKSNKAQTGLIELCVASSDGHYASIMIWSTSTTSNSSKYRFLCDGQTLKEGTFNADGKAMLTTKKNPVIQIEKSDNILIFSIGGKTYSFYVDDEAFVGASFTSVNIFCGQYKTRTKLVAKMGFGELLFVQNEEELHDIPNRYQSGDIITINGEDTKFYVEGLPSLGDEVLGTVYFKARPGTNKIYFYFSDFVTTAPTIKAYIREAWL